MTSRRGDVEASLLVIGKGRDQRARRMAAQIAGRVGCSVLAVPHPAARRRRPPGYSPGPMAVPRAARQDASVRDPVNELYDRGSDLVEAALAIRMVTRGADVAPAVPSLLACIECALDELAFATGTLAGEGGPAPRSEPAGEALRQALTALEEALRDARDRADAARVLGSEVAEPPPVA